MNWSKAKTILIIAFIITDIFLIIVYFKPAIESETFNDNEALAKFLAQKNIYVDADRLPKARGDVPVLFVHNENADCEEMKSLLKEQRWRADGNEDEDYKKAAGAFIKETGLRYNTASFSGIDRTGEYVRAAYKNVVNNLKVEKSYVTCIFKDSVLIEVDCDWLKVIRIHDKPQKTISAAQALLLFMAQNIDSGSIYIDDIEMVYWLDESVQIDVPVSEDTAFPVWKITYNGGDFNYIDAFEHN